jgi:DNA-binding CsgD family transcriptional regulator
MQFSTAVALIYETHIGDTRRDAMKQALCALLSADELVFTATRNDQAQDSIFSAGHAGEAEAPEYGSRDPLLQRSPGHILSLDIADRGYDKLKLLVLRNSDRVPFAESDLEWLSLLRPHLQNAEFVKTLMPEGVFGCAAGTHLVRSMSQGLAITTADGEIEWLNPAAQNILASGQGLMRVNGRIRAARVFETTRLELLIREAAGGRQGMMLVSHASMWLPYGLVFTPLEIDFNFATAMPKAREHNFVLVTIKDMQQHVDITVERLAQAFGLTKAEQQLGALLLAGCGLQEAAATQGKSLTTIKKQLRSMMTKTGTHSQAELLGMFLSVPTLL